MSRACAASACGSVVLVWTSCCARGPWAQLSILWCGLRAEGWLGGVGDVSYRPSSAIGMCGGRDGGVLGAKVAILGKFLFVAKDDVSEHQERSLPAEGSAKSALGRSRGILAEPASLSSTRNRQQDEGCWSRV